VCRSRTAIVYIRLASIYAIRLKCLSGVRLEHRLYRVTFIVFTFVTTFVKLAKWCCSSAEDKSSTQSTSKEGTTQVEAAVQPPPAPKDAEPKPSAKPSAAASPPKPKVAAAGGAKKAAKAVAKPLPETMVEDVIPNLTAYFEKEKGVSDVEIQFDDNQVFEILAGV
jgi:hypothetical protein